jgi:hypothetical protein
MCIIAINVLEFQYVHLILSFNISYIEGCTLVTDGFRILGVLVCSQDFVTHFLDEVLS